MKLRKLGLLFAQEFILLLVLLSAGWINASINPGSVFLKGVLSYALNILPTFIFWLLPMIVMFISIIGSYRISGVPGIVALIIVFSGGFFVPNPVGLLLLAMGALIGSVSMRE